MRSVSPHTMTRLFFKDPRSLGSFDTNPVACKLQELHTPLLNFYRSPPFDFSSSPHSLGFLFLHTARTEPSHSLCLPCRPHVGICVLSAFCLKHYFFLGEQSLRNFSADLANITQLKPGGTRDDLRFESIVAARNEYVFFALTHFEIP